jgi:hypothetical protein
VALPVNFDLRAGTELSTVSTPRVIIAACETQAQLDAQFEEAS